MKKTIFKKLALLISLYLFSMAYAEEGLREEQILIDTPTQDSLTNAVALTVRYFEDAKGDIAQFSAFSQSGKPAQAYKENSLLVFKGKDLGLDFAKIYI